MNKLNYSNNNNFNLNNLITNENNLSIINRLQLKPFNLNGNYYTQIYNNNIINNINQIYPNNNILFYNSINHLNNNINNNTNSYTNNNIYFNNNNYNNYNKLEDISCPTVIGTISHNNQILQNQTNNSEADIYNKLFQKKSLKREEIFKNENEIHTIEEICKYTIDKKELKDAANYISQKLNEKYTQEFFVLICDKNVNGYDFNFSDLEEKDSFYYSYNIYDIYICILKNN